MVSECCGTEIENRRIVFGKAGAIEWSCCECEAMRLTLKYENTKFQVSDVPETPRDAA